MTVRSGMSDLIAKVRRLVNDVDAAVWTDEQIQEALDRYRVDVWGEVLTAVPSRVGGDVVYRQYFLSAQDVEGTASTDAWRLYDAQGSAVTGYTLYGDRGLVVFSEDQAGSARYADYRWYDPYLSAADLWEERAGMQADKYDFGTGSDRFSRSQWFDHCLRMAEQMRRKAKGLTVPMMRPDLAIEE